ncbi:MAG TPA: hypothetical protein VND21_11915 [Planctomycetota bacterium]|nr:hypothetical protein [Planctomycetota bacterium]
MGSGLLPLFAWHARRRARSAAAIPLGLLVLLAVAGAALLPSGSGGAGAATEAVLLLAGVLGALVAVGSAGAHPVDRASGDARFLAALALPAPARRAAPAVTGALAALAASLAVGATALPLLGGSGATVPTWRTTPQRVETLADGRAVIDVGPEPGTLEIDLVPRYRDLDATSLGTVPATVTLAASSRTEMLPVRGTARLEVPGGPVEVRSADPRVDLRVTGARRVGASASFGGNLLLASLLLGIAGALGAPLAVLFSRGVSAPTAAAAAGVLMLVGAAAPALLTLAADADAVAGGGPASAILRAAVAVSPDLSVVRAASEAAAGRALGWGAFAALGPAALHALVCLLLAALLPAREAGA